MLTVKILGTGCSNCAKVESIAKQAATNFGIKAEFIKVTNYKDILAYNVFSTPGLVINEKLVSAGRIPSPAEIMTWLANAMSEA